MIHNMMHAISSIMLRKAVSQLVIAFFNQHQNVC